MKVKLKATITIEMVYDADSDDYGVRTIEEMIEIDKQNIEDDPAMFIGTVDGENFKVIVERVE